MIWVPFMEGYKQGWRYVTCRNRKEQRQKMTYKIEVKYVSVRQPLTQTQTEIR